MTERKNNHLFALLCTMAVLFFGRMTQAQETMGQAPSQDLGSSKPQHQTYGTSVIQGTTGSSIYHTGPMVIKDSKIASGEVIGPLTLEKVIFEKPLVATGPVQASKSQFKKLDITGPTKIQNSTLHEDVRVTGPCMLQETTALGIVRVKGPLKVQKSVFKKDVESMEGFTCKDSSFEGTASVFIMPEKKKKSISLDHSKGKNLVITQESSQEISKERNVKVVVKNHSVLEKIIFTGVKKGVVFVDQTSKVSEVVGGILKHKTWKTKKNADVQNADVQT